MTKQLSFTLLLTVFSNFLHCQDYHEAGLGFSGMRTWELNSPEFIMQDLNYYYAPNISYSYYFGDERFIVGFALGWVYETGTSELNSGGRREFREDIRNSLCYQVSSGVNILRTKKRFLQISLGVRALHTYFFKHYSEERIGGALNFGGYELDKWYDPDYSAFVSIGYHRALVNDLDKKQSLSLRISWDIEYQFPAYYGVTADGVVNEFSSIRMGPSVSFIWRIKAKKNNGLF